MANSASTCRHSHSAPVVNTIGTIFRNFGEAYIQQYKVNLDGIKLIRDVRKCRTPAMGGIRITCAGCAESKVIYKSCGNSKCPICQSIKRMRCQDKLRNRMLAVPYVHTTFTLPHLLNGLLRRNKKALYTLLYKSSWLATKELSGESENVGGLPGMIALMHTWGSDMKYHVHLHTLITFGGLDESGQFHYPKRKYKMFPYRPLKAAFRRHYLKGMTDLFNKGLLEVGPIDFSALLKELQATNWVIHSTRPTLDTRVIEEYLSRYLLRIAVSNNRLNYDEIKKQVILIYNDYRNQLEGEVAPKRNRFFDPLSFIHQFIEHLPPRYFQRMRYYGLHAPATYRRIKDQIPSKLKRKSCTVRTLIQILKALLGEEMLKCAVCDGILFTNNPIEQDLKWLERSIPGYHKRGPPAPKHMTGPSLPHEKLVAREKYGSKSEKVPNLH